MMEATNSFLEAVHKSQCKSSMYILYMSLLQDKWDHQMSLFKQGILWWPCKIDLRCCLGEMVEQSDFYFLFEMTFKFKIKLRHLVMKRRLIWHASREKSFFWHVTDFLIIWPMMSSESNSEKSVSYQKKDGRFFWYDNDKDLKVCFLVMHVILQKEKMRENLRSHPEL